MSRSEKRRREKMILVRVDEEEKRKLQEQAKKCGQSIAGMLRSLGLNYPLLSRVDQYALDNLVKSSANLGRLGGLFKLWLTKNQDYKELAKIGNYSYEDIEVLVNKINQNQQELLEISRKLL